MIKPKKIAILCNYELLPERVGGMDYFFWQFDVQCKENNIQVNWFFPNSATHGAYSTFTLLESQGQNVENFFLEACENKRLVYSHIITHFVELCTPFYYKLNKISNAKIIAVDHNPRPLNGYPLKKRIEKKVKGFLFSRYIDLFVGVSNYTVDEIIKDFGSHLRSKTITIYNGVLIEGIKVRVNRKAVKPSFMVVSHLRESKGIQDLIDAVYQLPDAIKSEIRITIFGDGPYKKFLLQKIKDYQLGDNFRFMGSQHNLNELYYHYDYLLQPTHMECFSLSILESLAANVPVVTTKVGGNEEAIKDGVNGYIFKAKDIDALTSHIEALFMGNKGIEIDTREAIRLNFSLENMVQNHLQLVL